MFRRFFHAEKYRDSIFWSERFCEVFQVLVGTFLERLAATFQRSRWVSRRYLPTSWLFFKLLVLRLLMRLGLQILRRYSFQELPESMEFH